MQDQYVGRLRTRAAEHAEEARISATDRQRREIIERYLLVASDASLGELGQLFDIWNGQVANTRVDYLAVCEVCEIIQEILLENAGLPK